MICNIIKLILEIFTPLLLLPPSTDFLIILSNRSVRETLDTRVSDIRRVHNVSCNTQVLVSPKYTILLTPIKLDAIGSPLSVYI